MAGCTRRRTTLAGRPSVELGPLLPYTTTTYDPASGTVTGTASAVLPVSYGFDARGNRTSVTAQGELTKYAFDAANRLISETNSLGIATTYTFDAAGSRATKVDGKGLTTSYEYDFNRRLTATRFADGTAYEYGLDALGRRIEEKGPNHHRTLAYDAAGRPTLVADVTLNATIISTYDADGHRTSVEEGGVVRAYDYDARGLLKRAQLGSHGWLTITHDALGRRERRGAAQWRAERLDLRRRGPAHEHPAHQGRHAARGLRL